MIFIIIAEVLYVVFHVFSNQKPIPELDEGKSTGKHEIWW